MNSQGNGCQGNKAEDAFPHSLDDHSPDFGFFKQNTGRSIIPRLRDADGTQGKGTKHFSFQLLPPSSRRRLMPLLPFPFSLSNGKLLCGRGQRENADFSGSLQGPDH